MEQLSTLTQKINTFAAKRKQKWNTKYRFTTR